MGKSINRDRKRSSSTRREADEVNRNYKSIMKRHKKRSKNTECTIGSSNRALEGSRNKNIFLFIFYKIIIIILGFKF
jgi:hypothetical protein